MSASPTPPDINPYAAPAIPGGYDPAGAAGIGVWRDGNLVVIHRRAAFPPVCIHTGEGATFWRKYALVWSYPIDWSARRLYLHLPLCEACYRSYQRTWWFGVLTIWLPAAALIATLAAIEVIPPRARIGMVPLWLICTVGIGLGGLVRWWTDAGLGFVRVREPYFWLKGADPRFLDHLPPWISGS
jgi:hypothetical protein